MTLPSITPGKIRGLSATSSSRGVFCVLAVDHRDSLRVVIDPERPDSIPASALTAVKLGLISEIGEAATAVMLDPEYSIAQAIATRSLSGRVGFIAALEAQGYLGDPAAVQTFLLDDWSVEKAKRTGADAVKLLVLYRPDAGAITDNQDDVIKQVIDACARHDIAIFLEPLAYPLAADGGDDTDAAAQKRRRIVIDSVRRLGALGPDILKIQFPVDTQRQQDRAVWRDACAELDDAAPVPWVLLSAGDPYELFRDQVHVACQSGASGFLAGRALWGEYVLAEQADRARLMEQHVLPRFAELAELASEYGRDWASRYQMPDPDERWFTTY